MKRRKKHATIHVNNPRIIIFIVNIRILSFSTYTEAFARVFTVAIVQISQEEREGGERRERVALEDHFILKRNGMWR